MNIIKSYIVTNAAASSGGGSGSLTSFSAGNLTPLFTTSVSNPTTTPALTFALVNQNANLVYAGPSTGPEAAPTFRALVASDLPSDSGAYWKTSGTSTLTNSTVVNAVSGADLTITTEDNILRLFSSDTGVGNEFTVELNPFSSILFKAEIPTVSQSVINVNPNATIVIYNQESGAGELTTTFDPIGLNINLISPSGNGNLLFTSAGLEITTENQGGASYTADYSGVSGSNPRWLPDVGYVLGAKTYTGQQTFSLTSLYANNTGIDVVATGGSDILNIGTSNADVINIGYSGSTVNITGTLAYQNVTNLQVTDKLFTVNKGGGVGSGVSAGFEIEENNVITGYFATNGTRDGWDFKAPAITGVATLSLASLTGNHTYTLPDSSGTIALTSNIIGPANGGTGVANNAASTLTISGNFATTFTVSGVTAITLPTSGTLATLSGSEILTNKTLSTGTVFSVIPTINDGITFTFNPNASVAGINVGQHAGNISTPVNGDMFYNSTAGSFTVGKAGTLHAMPTALSSANLRVPFYNGSDFILSSSANLTFATNRLQGTTLYLTVSAGTATAGTAPLKMTSGTNLTTAEAGAFEYNGADLFFTKSGTTRGTVLVSTAVTTEAVASDTTLTVTHNGTTYKILARA